MLMGGAEKLQIYPHSNGKIIMEQEILLACNIGDLPWLKASLEGSKKGINEIYNNEVRAKCTDKTRLFYSKGLDSVTLGCVYQKLSYTEVSYLQRARHQLLNVVHC